MVSVLNQWIKDQFGLTEASGNEDYISLTDVWNDLVDAWNDDFDWVSGTLFHGTKITLTKIEGVDIQVPKNLNIPIIGDFDIWDLLYHIMWFKLTPTVSVIGIPIPTGNLIYQITRNINVPFVGTGELIPIPQSGTTYHSNQSGHFTFKDLSHDIFRMWVVKTLVSVLGPKGLALIMQLVLFINRWREPKMKDIVLRLIPEGGSLKFDDDTELSIREELNYVVNYINQVLLYLMDPSHTVRPTLMSTEAMKGEPNIGL